MLDRVRPVFQVGEDLAGGVSMTLSETKHIRGLVSQGTHKDIESSVGWAVGGFEETRASRQAVRIVGNSTKGCEAMPMFRVYPFPSTFVRKAFRPVERKPDESQSAFVLQYMFRPLK